MGKKTRPDNDQQDEWLAQTEPNKLTYQTDDVEESEMDTSQDTQEEIQMEKIPEKTENQRGTNKEYEREEHKRNRAKTKTTKYKIGISEYRDEESDMLSELTKIEENRDIKLLQRVILQSKDRNGQKTEQETDALKKQVPERN